MLDEILKIYRSSSFDFRRYAYADDPLKDRFPEWVPYYRLKHSIARAIQPRSILEVGVRYGYSAFSFLDACPEAHYLGIDNNSEGFGGSRGSIYWAKEQARSFHADFLIADSQRMMQFPGGEYDLIHIDGQQDGLGTYHNLYLALHQADFILLDGFFWFRENFQSACKFLRDHRKQIEYFGSIPGYAGELLIRVAPAYRRLCRLVREAPEARTARRFDPLTTRIISGRLRRVRRLSQHRRP
jgi:SAM-dependent methyltransferase